MDISRDVIYRGFKLNDGSIQDNFEGGGGIGAGIDGCVIDSVDFSDVDVVQFMEKRSQEDGMDVGDVFKGVRRIRMAGTLYATTRALLFDSLWQLRAALDPALAQDEEPGDKGYQPLYFSVPTNRVDEYTSGAIDMRILAMPRAFQHIFQRDLHGGDDGDALAIMWNATLICRDPSIMGEEPQDYPFPDVTGVTGITGTASTNLFSKTAHGLSVGNYVRFSSITGGTNLSTNTGYYVIASGFTANAFKVSATSGGSEVDFTTDVSDATLFKATSVSGDTVNRGSYPAVLNILFEVRSEGSVAYFNVGDSSFYIVIPPSSGNRIIRLKGKEKVLTFEEEGTETLQMSAIHFNGQSTWPRIPPGEVAYAVTFNGSDVVSPDGESHMWFWEAYA